MRNNKSKVLRILSFLLTLTMCISLGTVVLATSFSAEQNFEKNVEGTAIESNTILEYSFETKSSTFSANTGSIEIDVSSINAGEVELGVCGEENAFSVTMLPENMKLDTVKDNIVSYIEEDGLWSSMIIAQEETIKQVSIINSNNAPNSYVYDFQLPDGAYLDYVRHEYNKEILNGMVNVYDSNGMRIGAVNHPSAVDADGIELESYFTITNNSLEQVIITDSDTAYPVVSSVWIAPISRVMMAADTTTIFKYFTAPTVLWNRDGTGKHSISLGGRTWNEETRHIHEQPAWQSVKACYDNVSTLWTNDATLYDQFICHSNLAQRKDPWNIEPWRPTTSFVKLELCLCNYPNCLWD